MSHAASWNKACFAILEQATLQLWCLCLADLAQAAEMGELNDSQKDGEAGSPAIDLISCHLRDGAPAERQVHPREGALSPSICARSATRLELRLSGDSWWSVPRTISSQMVRR